MFPKPKGSPVPAETARLQALLIQVIKRLMKYEPESQDLLDQVMPGDPNDSLEGL